MTPISPDEVVLDVVERFEALGLDPVIGGSYASSLWGHPRSTQDLDLSVRITTVTDEEIIAAFEGDYVVSKADIVAARETGEWPAGFQLLHMEAVFKIDVFIADDPELTRSILERSQRIEMLPGRVARFLSAEDIVLMKLRWYEFGNRISDRQWNDLVQVIEVQGQAFDRAYLNGWAEKLGILELAREALNESKVI